jgi:hypothetical protein
MISYQYERRDEMGMAEGGCTNSQSRGFEFRCVNIGYGALDGYHLVPCESFVHRNSGEGETDSEIPCLCHVLKKQDHRDTRSLY